MTMLTINGLQKAQRWNARAIANLKPGGDVPRAIQIIVTQLHRYELTVAHVDTGAMRASIRMEVNGMRGRTYVDPQARNPRTGMLTSVYAEAEEARGGEHAFASRTVNEAAPRIINQALGYIGRSLT